jgi:hypothetical protein
MHGPFVRRVGSYTIVGTPSGRVVVSPLRSLQHPCLRSTASHCSWPVMQRLNPSARNCFICLDPLEGKPTVVLKCSHEMCSGCWEQWVVTRIKQAFLQQKEKPEVRCPMCRRYSPVSAGQRRQAEHELNAEGYRQQPNNLWIQARADSSVAPLHAPSARAQSFVASLPDPLDIGRGPVAPSAPRLDMNRTPTLISSGLNVILHSRPNQPALQRSPSDVHLRDALGICPHGNHRSMCRLCDATRATERDRMRLQGAFDVEAAGSQDACRCTLS